MKISKLKDGILKIDLIFGKSKQEVSGITGISNPKNEFIIFVKNKKFLKKLNNLFQGNDGYQKCAYFFDKTLWDEYDDKDFFSKTYLVATVEKIDQVICELSKVFYDEYIETTNDLVDGRQMGTTSIHPTAWIAQNVFLGQNVVIGENVKIYSGCVIMSDCLISDDSVLYPNTTVYYRTEIGKRCRIHSGSVIGSDGFGYNFFNGVHNKIWHLGGVIIKDDVELGNTCTIDMGTFNPTIVGEGSKLDNQVHIAHNVNVGRGVILCGQSGIAGSSDIGDYCVFGGQSGVADNVTLAAQSQLAGGTILTSDCLEKKSLGGVPARPLREWLRGVAYVRKESLKK